MYRRGVKGSCGEANVGDKLTVGQHYGIVDNRLITFCDLTSMQKGDEWIFFLKYSPELENYWCCGDTDGRYPTENAAGNGRMSLAENDRHGV